MTKYERYTSKDGATLTMSQWGGSPAELELYRKLAELEDKIEDGTLVFKKEIPNKYYALVLHRDCYGKNSWHIHHVPIEYEKENNRVAIQVNGILYVTTKNMLFKTKAEAKAKLCELQFLEVAEHNIAIFEKKLRELEEKENV